MKASNLYMVGVLCLLMVSSSHAQTSAELHARYSAPKRETFEVRPGVDATVSYDREGNVCRIEVAPEPAVGDGGAADAAMSPDLVDAVLDELAPASRRGARVGRGDAEWGRSGVIVTQYEHAVIYRITLGVNRWIASATVEWNDTVCK